MIDARERLHRYRSIGLDTYQGFGAPGTEYQPGTLSRTVLYTISGSLLLELCEMEPVILLPGVEAVIEDGEEQRAIAGDAGWKYIVAWNPAEGQRFGH